MSKKNSYKHIADERMIAVMEYVVANKLQGISTQAEFCNTIDYLPNNIANIKSGKQSFSNENIRLCCIKFNISADYIYGLTKQVHRTDKKESIPQRLKAIIKELESKG